MARFGWLVLFICIASGCDHAPKTDELIDGVIKLGISQSEFGDIVRGLHGKDVTPGLAIVGPKGEHPVYGVVWEFADYEAFLSVGFKDQKLVHLGYCSADDFGVSKSHRARSTVRISQITFKSDKTTARNPATKSKFESSNSSQR